MPGILLTVTHPASLLLCLGGWLARTLGWLAWTWAGLAGMDLGGRLAWTWALARGDRRGSLAGRPGPLRSDS